MKIDLQLKCPKIHSRKGVYFNMAKLGDKDLYSSIIKKVIAKELTQKEAALKLEITDRQIRRIIVKYKSIGDKAFIHKNAGKPSHNKKDRNNLSIL